MNDDFKLLISPENILTAWKKFSSGKTDKKDVMEFWRNLENNIFNLHHELKHSNYRHGLYERFIVRDPKERIIHKAKARDRIVHQMIADYLLSIFEKRFIFDSYASRIGKGTHRAVKRFRLFCGLVSDNHKRPCWVLKCDIKKFFDSIDHQILLSFIDKHIKDERILKIIKDIIKSFELLPGKGLPLGNLTSQLFANIYLHELDYFAKHILRLKYYIRFNDDFAIAHNDKKFIESLIPAIKVFLNEKLSLSLPDDKIILRKLNWGVDFVGHIILPEGILIRTKTRKRIMRNIRKNIKDFKLNKISFNKLAQKAVSCLGILKHCSSFKLKRAVLNLIGDVIE